MLKIGQQAKLTFDTYPHKAFYGKINDISSAPIISSGTTVMYKAKIEIENQHLLLKPGMTVHARIVVAKKENVLSVPGNLFILNKKVLKQVAQTKTYEFQRLPKKEKEAFRAALKNKSDAVKTLWVLENEAFVQKPIEVGITDNAFFEVVAGITEQEDVIVDVVEPDVMAALYKQFFGGGLGGKK